MDKTEFLKQMIAFGQELLAQEQKPKLNEKTICDLQNLYNHLEGAVNAAANLEDIFDKDKAPKRSVKARKAVRLIIQVQELMNPLAEDEDIQLV